MNISSTIQSGIAPLEVTLELVDTVAKFVKWLWYFGDGSYSTERSPKHTYVAPGIYSVTLTTTDEFGVVYTVTKPDYIYVSAYTIGALGLISGFTDFCFKYAVNPSQGQGITPISGTWVWPMIIASTAKGYNDNHENISLVIDSRTMKIYQIGIPELWKDREDSYEEAEIACEALLPEISSRSGDQENVRHLETHAAMRSWDELRYRGISGYTADGFRNGQIFGIEIFSSGEQIVPTSKLRQVNKDGDYAFLKEIEAKRFQIKMKYATSAFRTTRILSHCQEIDHRTPPQLNDVPEKVWQKEFSGPDIWFSSNKPSLLVNRGDGIAWSGSGTLALGPDGKTSAFNSSGLSGTVGYSVSDFTIGAWVIGDGVIFQAHRVGGAIVSISVVGDILIFTDGIDTVQWPMSLSSSWRHLAVVLRGSNLELYEAGRMRISQVLSGIRAYGGACVVGNGFMFDIRRNLRAISAEALYYYYESILGGENGFLP